MNSPQKPNNKAANPICVEVTRGGINDVETVESVHRGRIAVVDFKGKVKFSCGDVDSPVFPRSAVKAFQALPAIESGAVDAYGFTDEEVAILGASHNGEAKHVQTVKTMLGKMGLDESALECGSHWPMRNKTARELATNGESPCPLHNNCSGKHAGMLAYAMHKSLDIKGYIGLNHPVQQRILGMMEFMCNCDMQSAPVGIDGCSVPTWAVPLKHIAFGFARFAAPNDLPEERARASRRLYDAVVENPFMVAGSDRYCTKMMEICKGRVFVKIGAEGVYCAALPQYGLGIALKCDDGTERGAELMMSATLDKVVGLFDDLGISDEDDKLLNISMNNWNKLHIGHKRGIIPISAE